MSHGREQIERYLKPVVVAIVHEVGDLIQLVQVRPGIHRLPGNRRFGWGLQRIGNEHENGDEVHVRFRDQALELGLDLASVPGIVQEPGIVGRFTQAGIEIDAPKSAGRCLRRNRLGQPA